MAPSYYDMAKEAIISLKERNGSSPAAIKKYIEENHPEVAFAQQHLRAALQRGVETGKLIKVKGSFKLSAASRALETAKAKREAKAKATAAAQKSAGAGAGTGKGTGKGKGKGKQSPADVARLTQELYDAARNFDDAAVKDLLERGADPNATSAGETPLHRAVRCPNVMAVLLDHGANPNIEEEINGRTPLHSLAGFAMTQSEIDCVNLLIERGADLEKRDSYGHTPLHCAASNHPGTIATLLLDKGADINAKDGDGHTPLWVALQQMARIPKHAVYGVLQERGAEL